MKEAWVPHDVRDTVVDFVGYWSCRTHIPAKDFIEWLEIGQSKFYDWKNRYGKVNEHNSWIPRDFWLEQWEKDAIVKYYIENPYEGYRRLTFTMLDEEIVAVSPSSVYRVLKAAGLMDGRNGKKSSKGKGFAQPSAPHRHWHVDVSYLNISGTFYYMCAVLDGYSRYIVHWEIRKSMKEADVEIILQRAKEKYPEAGPRIISDNGPQFIARDLKEFVRESGMSHVRTSPFYPQSNGKIERWHKSLKAECVRPKCPISLEEARRVVEDFVAYYNTRRLHSAIGYIAPIDKLEGREKEIFEARDRKLEAARLARKQRRSKNTASFAEKLQTGI